jgi:hypothetical protein
MAAEVGTSKTMGRGVQGRTISLLGCSASGAYALGPDKEEENWVHVRGGGVVYCVCFRLAPLICDSYSTSFCMSYFAHEFYDLCLIYNM